MRRSLWHEEFLGHFVDRNRIGHPAHDYSRRGYRMQGTLGSPHRLPRGRIEQACFQSYNDVSGMEGGRLSLPAPYLDVEGAAFEFATSSQISRFLGALGRLFAYGCDDHFRGNDLDASPCELLAYFCCQGIRDGDTPRTVCVRVQKL